MFIGHYSVSLLAKSRDKSIPLWVLFLAVQLVDVLWAIFIFAGLEKVRIVHGFTATNPLDLYYMPYTHSLLGSVFWAIAAFLLYLPLRKRSGYGKFVAPLIVGGAVLSHWFLDLVVHVPDLALYDNTLKMGFGLWNYPIVALLLELGLVFFGLVAYMRATRPVSSVGTYGMPMLMLLVAALQIHVFFGPDPSGPSAMALTAIASYFAIAAAAGWLERKRV
ncbi:MAG: hypothetical protein IPM63_11970 [Acidobacteriota bacterium]|nr:MAG: hypothetical protein IPM63_11970 [Acidobacteriota bacterium]